jgi:threonine/homoserine/homoserine lactone efflux protein
MELIAVFTGAFIIALSGAIVPGPLLTLTVGRAIEEGARAGPLIVLGHALSEIVVVVGMIFGLGNYLRNPRVTEVIAVVGGLVLLWMGFDMVKSWKSGSELEVEIAAAGSPHRSGSVITGIIGNISNPYWILWWATVGVALITAAMKKGVLGIGVFFTGHILADLIWYSLIAFSLSAGRRWLTGKHYQTLLLGCGITMLCLAAYFIWSGTFGNNNLGGLT